MNPTVDAPPAAVALSGSGRNARDLRTGPGQLPLWRLYVLRFGYLVIGVGLALTRWPLLRDHGSWPLMEGVVDCMLVAMSLLAFLGVRYPVAMLPLLLFESVWKLLWLGVVAVPQWSSHRMDAATTEMANACLWVVIVLAVIPWRHVFANYVVRPGERWR